MKEWGLLVKEVVSNKAKALENKQKIMHSILQLNNSSFIQLELNKKKRPCMKHWRTIAGQYTALFGQASQMHWTKVPLKPTAQPGRLRGVVEDIWRSLC